MSRPPIIFQTARVEPYPTRPYNSNSDSVNWSLVLIAVCCCLLFPCACFACYFAIDNEGRLANGCSIGAIMSGCIAIIVVVIVIIIVAIPKGG